ncbi:hypothetical protein T492DRAFT_852848 [Pavlovales sp. CCMP2436]|nr:hypothetical protein T492DRAFT_852848 [Pavlovales sp. CCMP2436]
MLNHHLAGLLGHQIHIALPINKLLDAGVALQELPLPRDQLYPSFEQGLKPFFILAWGEYADLLTFKSGLNPATGGLWLTIACLFIIAGHMYRTNWGIGPSINEILEGHKGPFTGEGHKGLYEILTTFWHAQLAINLAMEGSLTTDYATQLSPFAHHMWIGGFCVVGAGAHTSIFMVRDYDPTQHRESIISHLNWFCIFLGMHRFALGRSKDMFSDSAIKLEPVFAQWIQSLYTVANQGTAPNALATTSYAFGGDVVSVNGKVAMMPIYLGTADFMVHHIYAFTVHGTLFARTNLGFKFPCDGPGRGGTCQVSAWEGALSHITGGNFTNSSITINGWLRDFLWAQASQVIQSYGSALSAHGLIFLGAHFIWAFSLMFLFSGRVWAHNKLKLAPSIQPRALLSITQGRAVGLAHYLLRGIGTTWTFLEARIISVGYKSHSITRTR